MEVDFNMSEKMKDRKAFMAKAMKRESEDNEARGYYLVLCRLYGGR
jgi:hypothetical protein